MTTSKVDEPVGGGNPEAVDQFGVVRELRGGVQAAAEALCEAGRKASGAVKESGEGAYQFGAKTATLVARQVEAQPMASVVVAASLGLITGVLLARR